MLAGNALLEDEGDTRTYIFFRDLDAMLVVSLTTGSHPDAVSAREIEGVSARMIEGLAQGELARVSNRDD